MFLLLLYNLRKQIVLLRKLIFVCALCFAVSGYGEFQTLEEVENEINKSEKRLSEIIELKLSNLTDQKNFISDRFNSAELEHPFYLTIDLEETFLVDQIVLLPVIAIDGYDEGQTQDFPLRFRVVISEDRYFLEEKVVFDQSDSDLILNTTYPFSIEFTPQKARYVRIEILKLNQSTYNWFQVALSEVFVFANRTNVAFQKKVTINSLERAGGVYGVDKLVDGKTPYGLPERLNREVFESGWHGQVSPTRNCDEFIEFRFYRPYFVNELWLLPARVRHSFQLTDYGFPENFLIEAFSHKSKRWEVVIDHSENAYEAPGANPAVFRFEEQYASAIRIRVNKLRTKVFFVYVLAFAEIRIMSLGVNIAPEATIVESSIHVDPPTWSRELLTDGNSSLGHLLSWHTWLNELIERNRLEKYLSFLRNEKVRLITESNNRLRILIGGGVMILFISVGMFLYHGYLQRKRTEDIREQVAADLHDDIGSNLATISILGQSSKKHADAKSIQLTNQIVEIAQETQESMQDIVWMLHPDRKDLSLDVKFREIIERMMTDKNYKLDFGSGEAFPNFSPKEKRALILFLKEALHNAVRHTKDANYIIQLIYNRSYFQMTIIDDGIDWANQHKPVSLFSRAEELRGDLNIYYNEDQNHIDLHMRL